MRGLDEHITGNWGEDSVPPEFITAADLADMEAGQVVKIDVAPYKDPDQPGQVVATVERAVVMDGTVYVHSKEFAFPFVIPSDMTVYFADDEA
jgi:hypothetical protein